LKAITNIDDDANLNPGHSIVVNKAMVRVGVHIPAYKEFPEWA